MDKTALGDRMKMYEKAYASRAMPLLPILARIDGKNFSRWTKGLERPFDPTMSSVMASVTRTLVDETGARVGYTQSDEISLLWHSSDIKSQVFFDGKLQKIVSVAASMATAIFNGLAVSNFDFPHRQRLAFFDCRAWQVPTREEAVNYFLWRQRDAVKNSISMAASTVMSHKEMHKKHGGQLQEEMHQRGINWNDYPAYFKRGTFVRAVHIERPFSADEMKDLPVKHEAHSNPDLVVRRRDMEHTQTDLGKTANRLGFVFEEEAPLPREEE